MPRESAAANKNQPNLIQQVPLHLHQTATMETTEANLEGKTLPAAAAAMDLQEEGEEMSQEETHLHLTQDPEEITKTVTFTWVTNGPPISI